MGISLTYEMKKSIEKAIRLLSEAHEVLESVRDEVSEACEEIPDDQNQSEAADLMNALEELLDDSADTVWSVTTELDDAERIHHRLDLIEREGL